MAAILVLMGSFYAIDGRFAKSEELKKQEAQIVKTLEQFQNKLEGKSLRDRVDTLRDQKRQLRIMMKKDPKDMELKDQYDEVEKETTVVKDKLNELEKKQ